MSDLKYGWRFLVSKPFFTFAAVATLALGVGANTAVFAVIYSVLVVPLPYEHSDQLIRLWDVQGHDKGPFSFDEYLALSGRTSAMQSLAAYFTQSEILTGGKGPEKVSVLRASVGLLPTLRVHPLIGPGFSPGADAPGTPRELMLSYDLWYRDYQADPSVIGRSVHLAQPSYTIVGVLPSGFHFEEGTDILMPLRLNAAAAPPTLHFLSLVARMRGGFTPELTAQALQTAKNSESAHGVLAISLQHEMISRVKGPALLVFGSTCLILLIACANVSNLLLVRSVSRRTELAIRLALGASQRQISRQFLIEGFAIAFVSGILGALLARFILGWAQNSAFSLIPRSEEVHLQTGVLLFTGVVSVLAAILSSLGAALHGHIDDLEGHLRSARQSGPTASAKRWQNILVAAELALTVMLLCGAGLLIRSFNHVMNENKGFTGDRVFSLQFKLTQKYDDPRRLESFFDEVRRRLTALPWVESVGVVNTIPLAPTSVDGTVQISGNGNADYSAEKILTDGGYFKTLRIPVVAGRLFDDRDSARGAKVAIIDETLARKACGGAACLGRVIDFAWGQDSLSRVVGVVGPVRQAGLEAQPKPTIYVPYLQRPELVANVSLKVLVRASLEPKYAESEFRTILLHLDQDQPPPIIHTMSEIIDSSLTARKLIMTLLIFSAAMAALLSILGIYGTMSYTIATRTSEFGLRMALGARRWDVILLVLQQGLLLASAGISLGLIGAAVTSRLLSSMLYGTSALDPLTFVSVPALAALIVLVAALIPMRRALAAQPSAALKWE